MGTQTCCSKKEKEDLGGKSSEMNFDRKKKFKKQISKISF